MDVSYERREIPAAIRGCNMVRAKRLLIVCAVVIAACSAPAAALAADQLVMPSGSRVGIIVMMHADLTHYHVGKSRLGSFMRTYRISWPLSRVIDEPIAVALKQMGFEPVFLDATEQLRRQKQAWIAANPLANKLPRGADEELQLILDASDLQGIVLVAPGPNTNPDATEGDRMRRLPAYVQGWGFSTSDEPDGIAQPVVFNLTQMLIVGRSADSPELIFRDWGGIAVYEWPGFQPGADLKALPADVTAKFRPVIETIMENQIARLTPRIRLAQ
jgi:hypothetical protein